MTKKKFYCDVETFSDVDLKKCGAYRYVESPRLNDLTWAWAWDDEPIQGMITEDDTHLPQEVLDALSLALLGKATIVAHNANFERLVMGAIKGTGYLPPEWFDDTAARAAIWGFPRSLDGAAKAVGLDVRKNPEGSRLINKFSKPNRKGERNRLADHPEDAQLFVDYNITDVDVLRELDRALPAWPKGEREVWLLDQTINDRGLDIDLGLAAAGDRAVKANAIGEEINIMYLTRVRNPNSRDQMLRWLNTRPGLENVTSLDAESVLEMLEREDLDDTTRTVLEGRQRLAPSATRKFTAMLLQTSQETFKAQGQFLYSAAHTGRWGGRGFQPQNLPRLWFEERGDKELDSEEALRIQLARQDKAINALMAGKPTSPEVLKKLIRPCIVGPVTAVDFSQIEARVLAWVAGEEWALQAFREGREIYVETAKQMEIATGVPYTRQQGKTAVLALGYAGAVGALYKMGFEGSETEAVQVVQAWREANPNIRQFWNDIDRNLPRGGLTIGTGAVQIIGKPDQRKVFVRLPSGRALSYRKFSRRTLTRDDGTTYDAWGFVGSKGVWEKTWRGSLTENLVQAIARDLLVHAMLRLEEEGYVILGHIHDEVLVQGEHDVDEISRIMCDTPDWAAGLPMGTDGAVMARFRK